MIDDLNNNIEMRENDFIIIEADRDKYKEVFERRNDTISELEQHGYTHCLWLWNKSSFCLYSGKNNRGMDIRARFRGIDFVFQCKIWKAPIDPSVIRELDGALTQPKNSEAIGIVVIFDDSWFSLTTIERAITSIFPIILTDNSHLPKPNLVKSLTEIRQNLSNI